MPEARFSPAVLQLDAAQETERIITTLRHQLARDLRRRGVVIGLSGGIDSTVTAALAVRALGKDKVFGILMPERHSQSESSPLGFKVAESLGIKCIEENITDILEALGFYRRYDEAIREVIPAFGTGWISKLVIGGIADGHGFTTFSIVAQSPDGKIIRERLPLNAYLGIVAATNFKQRTRKMLEYYHADRLNYAVAGTPNRLEYDQGFFVKNGDGSADVKPIAHLYKTQVYQLAEHLGVPLDVRQRPPTTDTYSMPQGQDEFYFALPYAQMDLCLYGLNHQIPATEVATAAGLTPKVVEQVWTDIQRKRSTTRYLHLPPLLIEKIDELAPSTTTSLS
jgi:NAD+ synthase